MTSSEDHLTAKQLIELTLEQVRKTNRFNAYVTIAADSAIASAAKSDSHFCRTKTRKSTLEGIPVAVKDNFCIRDMRTTCASKMLTNYVPSYTATVVERLLSSVHRPRCKERQGQLKFSRNKHLKRDSSWAIIIGKCNMDEFGMGSASVESVFGPVKNPLQFRSNSDFFIAGGSSGGCAVSVLSNTCFAAIGSDTGGSVRNPASYCGLVGLKPTYGRVSRHGLVPLVNSMDVPGVITRSVDDCALIYNTIAGHDANDATSVRLPFQEVRLRSGVHLDLSKLKIGIPEQFSNEHLDAEVWDVWNSVAGLFADAGASLQQVSMPSIDHSSVCYSILNECDVMSNMAKFDGIQFGYRNTQISNKMDRLVASNRTTALGETVKNRILAGCYFLLEENRTRFLEKALRTRTQVQNDFDKAWETNDILLTPTTLTTAIRFDDFVQKSHQEQCQIQDFCTVPANLAGVPAITVPIRNASNGMPISVQIMGKCFDERLLLNLAKFIEENVNFSHQSWA